VPLINTLIKLLNVAAIFDVLIRLMTIILRGIFVFSAVKYLDATDFSLYVTLTAIISLLQYLVAGDYSYIAHREFLAKRFKFEEIIATQFHLLIILFLITCPILFFLIPSLLRVPIMPVVFLLLLLESVTSEIQRHLVVISKFTRANLVLFFKSAGWMTPIFFILYLNNDLRNINTLIIAWSIGLTISFFVGILGIFEKVKLKLALNKNLIKKYLKTVPLVLVGTLATRALFSLDRIILEKCSKLELVGVYGLYVGVAAAFVAILDAGVLSRSFPQLVTLSFDNPKKFKELSKKIQIQVVGITCLAVLVYELTINIFLHMISKSSYIEQSDVGLFLILAYAIYSLSFPLNCRLYALNKDKTISLVNAVSLFPLVIISISNSVSLNSVALAVTCCATLHYILRFLVAIYPYDKKIY